MQIDHEQESISLASAMQQTESMRQETRHSKTRTLIALLASTFLLVMWVGALGGMKYVFVPLTIYRYVLAAPAAFNLLAWLFWVGISYRAALASSLPRNISPEELNKSFLIYQYEAAQHMYRRQSRRSAVIETTLACQFIFMGVHAAAALFSFSSF